MSSVLVRNGSVLISNGSAISYQGTEYVINASSPVYSIEFDLATVGLTVSDVVMDESTYFWIETTADISFACWLDSNDDDDFYVTIPNGTKFIGTIYDTSSQGITYNFSCVTSATYGFIRAYDDSSTMIGMGLGWFTDGIDYAKPIGQTGDITDTHFALHVVKMDSSGSSANIPNASGVSF